MAVLPYVRLGSYEFPDVQEWEESMDSRVSEQEIPRRHGALIGSNIYAGVRNISFKGYLHSSSATTLRTELTNLQAYLNNVNGVQNLYVHNDRYIKAVKKSCAISYPTGLGFQVAEWSVSFVCGDPFYYSTTATCASTASQANLTTRRITYSGTAPTPIWWHIYATSGSVTGLTIYQVFGGVTVANFRYLGTITTDYPGLIINSDDFTATYNSVAVGTAFEGDFLNMRYTPGGSAANTFVFQQVGSVSAMANYTDRYF